MSTELEQPKDSRDPEWMGDQTADRADTADTSDTPDTADTGILYGVEDNPSPWLTFVFGLQHAVMTISGTMLIPFILANMLCEGHKADVTSQLLSITMFMCGVATIIQVVFGVRLGLIQGGSLAFVAPIIVMMTNDKWSCQATGFLVIRSTTGTGPQAKDILCHLDMLLSGFLSLLYYVSLGLATRSITGTGTQRRHVHAETGRHFTKRCCFQTGDDQTTNDTTYGIGWKDRMREIQGNLILASFVELFIGLSGVLGFLLRYIGPLTVAPTITLIGLSLTQVVIDFSQVHWGVAFFSMFFTLLFAAYLGRIKVPIPTKSDAGWQLQGFPMFQLFPVVFSIGLSWIFCAILTVTDVIPNNTTHYAYMTRTDARSQIVNDAPWFHWPYPSSAAGFSGFLAATAASIIESVGDYYAAARISGAPPLPPHAVNRGIAMEGFASVISGMVGAGHGTTSYSSNIGAIGITKVASRRVFIMAGVILIVCGLVGKFGAILASIPDPVIGGMFAVLLGMVVPVGMSTLKYVDVDCTRNLTILGMAFMLGLVIPQFVNNPKNAGAIDTGNSDLDQVIKVLCGSSMFVGGVTGFILDNTVPGTDEERGILSWRQSSTSTDNESTQRVTSARIYDFPYVMKYIRRMTCCSYLPISPTFDNDFNCNCCRGRDSPETSDEGPYDTTKTQNGAEP